MADRRRSSDLSISDYIQAARFHPWAVVLPMLVIGVLAWFFLGRGDAVYEAEAEVQIGTTQAQDSFDASIQDRVNDANFKANQIRFANADSVLDEVGARLGPDAPDDLDDLDVEITADEEADILVFTAQDSSPEGAAELANLYADVYVEQARAEAVDGYAGTIETIEGELEDIRASRTELRSELDAVNIDIAGLDEDSAQRPALEVRRAQIEAELAPQLTSLDSQETAFIDRLSDLEISRSLAQTGTAEVSTVAVPDSNPLPSAGTRALIIGEIVGLILGLMLAVTLESTNDRLREVSEVERHFPDLPILGTIPYESSVRKRRELTVLAQPGSNFSESINQVRTSLRFMNMEQGVRLVVVTSSLPSEGKTTFTTNFAWALAGLKEKVVLIDGDLRRPVAHQHFGVELAPGLTDLVIDKRPIESVEVLFEEQEGNFSIIPAGTNHGNPADFLGSTTLVDRVKEIADDSITVVDAAPVLPVSDARALAGASDLTILMVRVGDSRRSDVAAAIQNLRNAGATSIALVLVGVKPEASAYYGDADRKRSTGSGHPTQVRAVPGPRPIEQPSAQPAMAPVATANSTAAETAAVPTPPPSVSSATEAAERAPVTRPVPSAPRSTPSTRATSDSGSSASSGSAAPSRADARAASPSNDANNETGDKSGQDGKGENSDSSASRATAGRAAKSDASKPESSKTTSGSKPDAKSDAKSDAAAAARVTERRPGGAVSADDVPARPKRAEARTNGARTPEANRQAPPDRPRRSRRSTGDASTDSAPKRPKGPKRPPPRSS